MQRKATRGDARKARPASTRPSHPAKTRRQVSVRSSAPGARARGSRADTAAATAPKARPRAPLSDRQARMLLNLEQTMSRRIMGKDDAVARVARVVRVRMAQLDFRPDRPNGSFLLVGPTGVGKNELAYTLAESLYGSEEGVVSIDLAELAEESDLARLGVLPVPGSSDQAMEGILTSPVRAHPRAVVLLRGLERAHPSFQTVLQQILEQGRLDDLLGPVFFNQAIIFVTTRPKRDESTAVEIGFSRTSLAPMDATRKRLERSFSPDLLDSFNEIIELPPLTPEDVRRIARYKVEAVLRRLQSRHRAIEVAENVFENVIPEEQARLEGAAMLNRTLEDRLFNPLARFLLEHRRTRSVQVDMDGGNLRIRQ